MSANRFDNKVIVVTGGAQGQGEEEARLLAAQGANVIITDIQDEKGIELARSLGPHVEYRRLDVSSEAEWRGLEQRLTELGGLDGLVCNAAIFKPGGIETVTEADFDRHYRINQYGAFLGLRCAACTMARGGSVVIVSSAIGLKGTPGHIAYLSTKWAVRGMAKAAAIELAPKGLRVNSIHPGIIDTTMLDVWSPSEFDARVARVPMQRAGTVGDIAPVVLFLLGNESAYMTGAELAIDGGLSL